MRPKSRQVQLLHSELLLDLRAHGCELNARDFEEKLAIGEAAPMLSSGHRAQKRRGRLQKNAIEVRRGEDNSKSNDHHFEIVLVD